MSSVIYKFGEFRLILKRRQLFKQNGELVSLSPLVFNLLLLLIENRGVPLSDDSLIEKIWENRQIEDSNITTSISVLRKALGDNNKPYKFIDRVNKVGYCFIGDVEEISEEDSEKIFTKDKILRDTELVNPFKLSEKDKSTVGSSTLKESEQSIEQTEETLVKSEREESAEQNENTEIARDENIKENSTETSQNENSQDSEFQIQREEEKLDAPKRFTEGDAENPKVEKGGFGKWVINNKFFVLILVIVVILSILIPLIISEMRLDKAAVNFNKEVSKLFTITTSIAHAVVIIIAFGYFWLRLVIKRLRPEKEDFEAEGERIGELKPEIKALGYTNPDKWIKTRKIAKIAFEQYSEYWHNLLIVWFILYLFIALAHIPKLTHFPVEIHLIRNLLNNFNTLYGFLCFNTLYKPIKMDTGKERIKDIYLHLGLIFIVIWLVVEIVILYSGDGFIYQTVPEDYKPPLTVTLSELASGILGGITLALFIGRLQSKFLGLSGGLLFTLYFYVAIQPLYVFFDNPTYTAVIIPLALFFKCLLLSYMFWLFQSGRLFYYFVRVRLDYEKEWKDFRQVLR